MARAKVTEDYYSILEVSRHAPVADIKESYKRLALRCHPDKNRNATATSEFQVLSRAWEVLRDPERRREYDRELERELGERLAEEATRRWEEINREARTQWERQRGSGAEEAERKQKARLWKVAVRKDYVDRLKRWTDFQSGQARRIADYRTLLRRQQVDLQAQSNIEESEMIRQFEEAIARSESSGKLAHDRTTTLMLLLQGRRDYITRLTNGVAEARLRIKQLLSELECGRSRYEEAEAHSRQERIQEALEILGPRDMNPPLFCIIDRRGQAINHWRSLERVRSGPPCCTSLGSSSEGPWHREWDRVVGEHICSRCSQSAFHIIQECGPARCPVCSKIICSNCYRDLKLLHEYHIWITQPEDDTRDTLFSIDFEAGPEPPNVCPSFGQPFNVS